MYDIRLAKAITYTAQLVTNWVKQHLEKCEHKCIYGDTDSLYLCVQNQVKKLCSESEVDYDSITWDERREMMYTVSKKIDIIVAEALSELSDYLCVFERCLHMKRELFGFAGIWIKKKTYCIKLLDKEGKYCGPDEKPYVKGFDIAKSSANPKWILDTLVEHLELVFTGNSKAVYEFEAKKRSEFKELHPDDFSFIRSTTAMGNYSSAEDKGVQAHIKAAIIYNDIASKEEFKSIFPKVYIGDKIRYFYTKTPNGLGTNVAGYSVSADGKRFLDVLKNEYGIEPDFDTQWEKILIGPARRLTDAVGWNMDSFKRNSIFDIMRK